MRDSTQIKAALAALARHPPARRNGGAPHPALTSLIAGAVAGWIAPASQVMPWLLGGLLLAAFIPQHLRLWSIFPLWYHLTFLVTLAPLIVLGSRLPRVLAPATPAAPGAGS